MNASFFTQIGLILITVFIGVSYIKPTLENISGLQDQIFEHVEAFNQVSELNSVLQTYVAEANSISAEESRALITYMPNQIDEVAVMKDIEAMALQGGLILNDISYAFTPPILSSSEETVPVETFFAHQLTVGVTGTYQQIKDFLALTEQNNYPLVVTEVEASSGETGGSLLVTDIVFETYSLEPGRVTQRNN